MELPQSVRIASIFAASVLMTAPASSEPIALDAEGWVLSGVISVEDKDGVQTFRMGHAADQTGFAYGQADWTGTEYEDLVITYKMMFTDSRTFSGTKFRADEGGNSEEFYFRAHQSGNPDASQYQPIYNNQPSWQLYHSAHYGKAIAYPRDVWVDVKKVIIGDQADIYYDDMDSPIFSVKLTRESQEGFVSFWALGLDGPAWITEIDIREATESDRIAGTPTELPSLPEGLIKNWRVSTPFDGHDALTIGALPNLPADTPLTVNANGTANLTELAAVSDGADSVIAEFHVEASTDTLKRINFGYSDHALIFVNGTPVAGGSNQYFTRDYRFLGSIGFWDQAWLPLREGENIIQVVVREFAEDPTGWAVQAHFPDPTGLTFLD